VLFVIDLASRRVELAGIVHEPHEAWMKQTARNLTDRVDGFLLGKRYVIMDRDPLFTGAFRNARHRGNQERAAAPTQPTLDFV
jgi:putative transposase